MPSITFKKSGIFRGKYVQKTFEYVIYLYTVRLVAADLSREAGCVFSTQCPDNASHVTHDTGLGRDSSRHHPRCGHCSPAREPSERPHAAGPPEGGGIMVHRGHVLLLADMPAAAGVRVADCGHTRQSSPRCSSASRNAHRALMLLTNSRVQIRSSSWSVTAPT